MALVSGRLEGRGLACLPTPILQNFIMQKFGDLLDVGAAGFHSLDDLRSVGIYQSITKNRGGASRIVSSLRGP